MSAISINLFTQLQHDFGNEKAKTIADVIKAALTNSKKETEVLVKDKKVEIKEELKKELVTSSDLKLAFSEQNLVNESKFYLIEKKLNFLDVKFNFVIALMIIAITLMNPLAVELLRTFLK